MSWKGFKKALERMPHQLQSKIGRGSGTSDPEYDELTQRFGQLENDTKGLFEQTAQFRDSIRSMLVYQISYLEQILAVYRPISTDPDGMAQPVGSYVDEGASPELLRVAEEFHSRVMGIKTRVDPQLEALDLTVVGPIQEMMAMMRNVHRVMQKRDHKKIDYDRFKSAVEKAEAKEGSEGHRRLGEEKTYQKHAAQYQEASRQYVYFNDMLKAELRQLLDLRQAFIDPIFIKFFRMQHQLYSSLFHQFSDAARNCPAFDLSTPVIVGWQQKWGRAEQTLGSIDLWGQGHMTVVPLNVQETNKGVFDTFKGTFKKKDKSETPSAASVFDGESSQPPATSGQYGSVAPYGSGDSPNPGAPGVGPYGAAGAAAASPYPPPSSAAGPPGAPGASPYAGAAGGYPLASGAQPPKASPYGSYQSSFPQDRSNSVASGSSAGAAAAPKDSPYGNYQSSFPPAASAAGPSSTSYGGPMQQHSGTPPPAYGTGPAVAPPPEKPRVSPPGNNNVQIVEALYDYSSQTQGDLSFKEGDRIELVQRTAAKDDWWTGRLNGVVGVFPGTYVSDPK
ncbi:BAR adaptor protein Hob1 [Coemansia erecta]|uniref:BAR adaptor protein Hob1 n=1 Tax=Coemansia erecta TaxID=147472 RepID=A0A9W8CUG3_9FUNG|nr:BAR adaptor protein Hob1 [Coemansia erecta]